MLHYTLLTVLYSADCAILCCVTVVIPYAVLYCRSSRGPASYPMTLLISEVPPQMSDEQLREVLEVSWCRRHSPRYTHTEIQRYRDTHREGD